MSFKNRVTRKTKNVGKTEGIFRKRIMLKHNNTLCNFDPILCYQHVNREAHHIV